VFQTSFSQEALHQSSEQAALDLSYHEEEQA
jgi:hypothetical protein